MNIFIPLILGLLIGHLGRRHSPRVKKALDMLISISLLGLIFLMGVEAGKVEISASWLFGASIIFALATITGSLSLAIMLRRMV